MKEISKELADNLLKMMMFLNKGKKHYLFYNHEYYKKFQKLNVETYNLCDSRKLVIATLVSKNGRFYYKEI